jgi:hypothetical protein
LGGALTPSTVNGGASASGPSLGGLGLLSLANKGERDMIKEDREGEEGENMQRTDSGMGSERMDED